MYKYLRQCEPNPVLLYELRQAVRNRFVIGLMSLYLLLTVLSFIVLLYDEDALDFISYLSSVSFPNKATKLAILVLLSYYVFTTATLVIFAAVRTAADRLLESPVLYTLLSPRQIVSGKMWFGVVIGLLFLSITLPFLSVAYLMRGLDIRCVLCGSMMTFFMTQIQYFVTVAFFAGAKNNTRIAAMILPALLLQYLLVVFSLFAIPEISIQVSNELIFFAALPLLFFQVMTGLFLLTAVQFAPPSSNRMFPARITFFSIQLFLSVAFLVSFAFEKISGSDMPLEIKKFFLLFFMCLHLVIPYLFLFCICERKTISLRIRQTIPVSFRRRLFAFPFYTGVANAMVWCVLILFFEGVTVFIISSFEEFPSRDEVWMFVGLFNFGLLLFDYCATTLLVYNLLLYRWISRTWNWIVPFACVAIIILFVLFARSISKLLSVPMNVDSIQKIPFLPYPYIQYNEGTFVFLQMTIGLIWFALLAAVSLPWLRRQFMEFRR